VRRERHSLGELATSGCGVSSLHALRANVATLRLRDRTRIFRRDALPFAAALTPASYDIAFADPPYESRMLDRLIDTWKEVPFARVLTVEHAKNHVVPRGQVHHVFGDGAITIYRARPIY
jgi:16S rRNA (guanine966-N2)-methyltransferase